MPELLRLDGILAKSEGASYGVDAAPSNTTDGVRISRRLWSNIQIDYQWENLRDEVASSSIIPLKPALPRGRKVKLEIFWEVKGAGSDAVPEAAPLYIACGLPETDGASVFDYGPITSGTKGSCTIWAYAGGVLFKVVGCRGHFRWPLVVGEVAVHQFTMFGTMITEPATTSLATITYDSPEPIAGVNTALTIGSWTPEWLSGELDLQGVDPEPMLSGNIGPTSWTDGIASFDFGSVNPMFRLTARKVALATYDPMADLKARTSRSLAMTFGPAQFNRVGIVSAPLAITRHGLADSEGFVNWELEYMVESGGVIRFS